MPTHLLVSGLAIELVDLEKKRIEIDTRYNYVDGEIDIWNRYRYNSVCNRIDFYFYILKQAKQKQKRKKQLKQKSIKASMQKAKT